MLRPMHRMTKSTAVGIGAVAALLVAGTVYTTHARNVGSESGRVEIVDVASRTGQQRRPERDEKVKAAVASLKDDLQRANKRIAQLEAALVAVAQVEEVFAEELPEEERQEAGKRKGAKDQAFYIDKAYGGLLNELNLSADVEATARELLYDALVQRKAVTGSALNSGDLTASEIRRQSDEIAARLGADLSEVMNGNELAQWEEHEASREWIEMEQSFEVKLGRLSPGLTVENRQVAAEVIVEEHFLAHDAFYQSDTPYTESALNGLQIEVAQYSRDRLAGFLPEDQFAEVDRLLTIMELMAGATHTNQSPAQQKQ